MKKPLLIFISLFLTQFAFGQNEKSLVLETFENYKSSILENRGTALAELVSERTLEYYDIIIHHAIKSDSVIVDNLPYFDKFTVLFIRHFFPIEETIKMDSNAFLKYATENDFFGKESIIDLKIDDVKLQGSFAQGIMIRDGKQLPISYHFYKEDETWKIDLVSLTKMTTGYIIDFINSSDYTVNSFILTALSRHNGKEPKPTIWQPIN
ncbi:hypothetical protein SYJ56_20745 [Algoriphagus sp. D3-2-R+10]|uniref:hypothetical protein n=1 Tax=Algoriphagus aurantiacus TaxID=3103948 RepID=UPI002B3674B0|nr:hypothetical protein [Algoriphagus sp. D3-2-R+10]MEB2777755.1 hypothetical protein [Algoriphagus sp. D3-2-R+10]